MKIELSSTSKRLLALLQINQDSFVSGAKIADEFGVSRNAVWKAVKNLEQQGYGIEAVRNKGYRLIKSDILTLDSVLENLKNKELIIKIVDEVDSTNRALKEMAENGLKNGFVYIAKSQIKTRTHLSKINFEPNMFFSVLFRPDISLNDLDNLNKSYFLKIKNVLERLFNQTLDFTSLNELYLKENKIGGILSEVSLDFETKKIDYLVVGIGIDLLKLNASSNSNDVSKAFLISSVLNSLF